MSISDTKLVTETQLDKILALYTIHLLLSLQMDDCHVSASSPKITHNNKEQR